MQRTESRSSHPSRSDAERHINDTAHAYDRTLQADFHAGHGLRLFAMASRKRARTAGEGEEEGEAVPVADGFEAPIFGARVVGQVTTLALEGEDGPLASLQLLAVASDRAGGWYVTTKEGSLLHVSAAGRVRTVATCEECRGIVLSPDGSVLFLAGGHKIRRVEVATGAVTTLAGSGEEGDADGVDAAQFNDPYGVTISPDGSALFVADFWNHKIRRVEVATGAVTTVAGSGEEGDEDGVGGAAQFACPAGVAVSPDGSALFVADLWNHKIRRVEVATGAVTTVAGSGAEGSADGVGGAAEFAPMAALFWSARERRLSARSAWLRLLRLPPSRQLWCRPRPSLPT